MDAIFRIVSFKNPQFTFIESLRRVDLLFELAHYIQLEIYGGFVRDGYARGDFHNEMD